MESDLLAVFNIQKFSLHDGPGIRTVVFLKGCPLRCGWCSNPESQNIKTELFYDTKKCLHCGTCVLNCANNCIANHVEDIQIDRARCGLCLNCAKSCPGRAICATGEQMTVSQVMAQVLKDQDFYRHSGGGVTLSGGEPLLQAEGALSLLRALKQSGIHRVIETSGYAAKEDFLRLCNECDLLIMDIKHYDSKYHQKGTGVGNEQILKNAAKLSTLEISYEIRIPVIPGFNDALQDAAEFARLFLRLSIRQVSLLPFHQYGENKYFLLGRNYAYRDLPALNGKNLSGYAAVLQQNGIKTNILG